MSNLERDVCTIILLCVLHTPSNVLLAIIYYRDNNVQMTTLVCAQIFFIQVASKIELFQCENILMEPGLLILHK